MNIVTQNKIMKDALEKIATYDDYDPMIDCVFKQWANEALEGCKTNKVFSGPNSEIIWDCINDAKTTNDLKRVLYFVCCGMQELESKYDKILAKLTQEKG